MATIQAFLIINGYRSSMKGNSNNYVTLDVTVYAEGDHVHLVAHNGAGIILSRDDLARINELLGNYDAAQQVSE